MIEHDVHVLSGECHLTLVEAIPVDGISLLKGPKDRENLASAIFFFKMDIFADSLLTQAQKFIQVLEYFKTKR